MYQLTQHKFWGVLALIISIMFVVGMVTVIGCGDDDDDDDNNDDTVTGNDDDDDDAGPPPATDVTVNPPAGATVPSNQEFTLTFNEGVKAATANGVAATGAGTDWTVTPFAGAQGSQNLTITWTNRDDSSGNKSGGAYTVDDPDTEPPEFTSQTVNDGDADVDPAPINQGGLRFDFNEAISGSIKLTDEAGADLNWQASVAGQTATLTAIAGQELANETTYKVEFDIKDGAGNALATTSLTFVTKPKE